MDCRTVKLNEKDQFISKIGNSDSEITSLYQYDAVQQQSFTERMAKANNGREKELATILQSYMNDLDLTPEQQSNLKKLADGAKVVIGGQQAGLFGGPLYTFHKIFSIITLARQVSEQHDQPVVPIFWIAGEDHDFDEVNHTYAFNQQDAQLHKIKYHTMTPPESSVSRFYPDKEELQQVLKQLFTQFNETSATKPLYDMCSEIIAKHDTWSDMFKHLLHRVFKDYGVLLIDAQFSDLRQLEKPLFKQIIQRHDELDQAFRTTQRSLVQRGFNSMIQTESNAHLFLHEDDQRQLLSFKDGKFVLSKSEKRYDEQQLLNKLAEHPEMFSNNVVTRPLMEEWLFNTVAFVGGPSEIKYWTELRQVFDIFDVEMPIVMPRMRISYMYDRTAKLLERYQLDEQNTLVEGVEQDRFQFIRSQASEDFIKEVEEMKQRQERLHQTLLQYIDNEDNKNLVNKNNDIHLSQYEYLMKRYLLNIERDNDISMKHFREIQHNLHPMGGLQERIWNPLQIMNDFGIDVFSPSTYPPLDYTFDHIIIKP